MTRCVNRGARKPERHACLKGPLDSQEITLAQTAPLVSPMYRLSSSHESCSRTGGERD